MVSNEKDSRIMTGRRINEKAAPTTEKKERNQVPKKKSHLTLRKRLRIQIAERKIKGLLGRKKGNERSE